MDHSSSSKLVLSMQRRFGLYVNARRALPAFGDGLKDAARKALHVMRNKARTKTQALSGAMVDQRLYVHGDASQAINTIVAPFGNNLPLLSGLGNFGTKLYPRAYAASRYTEVERPSYADLIYADYDIVPMESNYDDSNHSPVTLLPPIPLLLVNGSEGMGYGWSSTVLPRDPAAVAHAVADILAGKKPKRLVPWMGWSACRVEFVDYSANGGCTWRFTGRAEVIDTSTIALTEIPPDSTLEDLIVCLSEMEEADLINDFEDHSAKEVRVIVKLKRGVAKDWTEADAIAYVKRPGSKVPALVATKTENFVTISADGDSVTPYKHDPNAEVTDPVERYLRDWVAWRFGWYKLRFELLLATTTKDIRLAKCVIACHDAGLPKKLAKLKSRDHLRKEIEAASEAFLAGASPEERKEIVSHISSLATYRWIAEERDLAEKRLDELKLKSEEYWALVADESKRRGVFMAEAAETLKVVDAANREIAKLRARTVKKKR